MSRVILDQNGIDPTDVMLVKNVENTRTTTKRVVRRIPNFSNIVNSNPEDVSLYDLPMHGRFDNVDIRGSVTQPVSEFPINEVRDMARSSLLDSYSNTRLPLLRPHVVGGNTNLPNFQQEYPTVMCNEGKVNIESINRDAVDFYDQYAQRNYIPLEHQEDSNVLTRRARAIIRQRLLEAKNTHNVRENPSVVRYDTSEIPKMYAARPKFENNKMNPRVGPNIISHMKNADRVYEQSLKLI